MKICFLTHATQKDTAHGIDRYSSELINRVRKTFDVTVVELSHHGGRAGWFSDEIASPLRVAGTKADVYHSLSQVWAKSALVTGKRPLITTIHDLIPFNKSTTSFYQKETSARSLMTYTHLKLCTILAKRSDILIVPFEVTKKDLISTLKVKESRIRIVNYGVDTIAFRPLGLNRKKSPDLADKKIVFFIGGMSRAKGLDVLLQAFSLLKKEQIGNCELWVAGKWRFFDGVQLAKELGVHNSVRFLGHIPEKQLPTYYNSADVLAFPYKIGFALPILEGMACKKPVIASDTPDVREVVGKAGLLVPPTDVGKLHDALLLILTNKNVEHKLAEAAFKRASLFSWEKTAKETMRIYDEFSRL